MENKEDIINSPAFENLKSYTVFRRRAPPIHNSADVVLAQTSVIRNWHFKFVSSTSTRYWFVLYGTVNNSFIKSSLVTDVVEDVVRTENSFYKLSGDMSAKCDPHRHFDKELLKHFQHGFPPNWRSLLEGEIRRIVALEASLAAKGDANSATTQLAGSNCEEQNAKDESVQKGTRARRDVLRLNTEKSRAPRKSTGVLSAETLSTTRNVAKSRLSLEKKLIAQKAAEILSSDSEDATLVQKPPEKAPKGSGKKRGRKKKAEKELAHGLEKISEKQDGADKETGAKEEDTSSARTAVALRDANGDEARPQVAIVKKRVSFNTEDIQEIILDGKDEVSAAGGDVPDVPMDLVAGGDPEKESEAVNFEGTGSAPQVQAAAQPRKRGRTKSVDRAVKQQTAKGEGDAKNNDDRKPGAKRRRRRLTMPAGFKT